MDGINPPDKGYPGGGGVSNADTYVGGLLDKVDD